MKRNIIYYNSTLLKGGTDTYMLEIAKNVNKEKFQLDIIIKDGDNVDEFMFKTLKDNGCNIFLAKGSFLKRMLFLRKFFKQNKNKYDVCHINATSQGTGIISYFAKKLGKIKTIIFHSHMGGNDNNKSIVDMIGSKLMFRYSTDFASCSSLASLFMFGKEFCENHKILKLNNSVDVHKFKFNSEKRNQIRKELNINDSDFVVLHVGRFAIQKNHKKLIDIFVEIHKQRNDSKLLLIGNGDLFEEIKNYVSKLNLSNNVVFLGLKNNVCDYMQAADCFVMPSIHEGLPIVAVEAQTAGLHCILSSNISSETKLSEFVEFIDINKSDSEWAIKILNLKQINRNLGADFIINQSFDHESAIKKIEELYSK